MKPPRKVLIGPVEYDVKVVKNQLTTDLLGETLNEDALILIRKNQAQSQRRETFIHECLHAMIFVSGMKAAFGWDAEAEEKVVVSLSPWLTQWIIDNGEAIEYVRNADA